MRTPYIVFFMLLFSYGCDPAINSVTLKVYNKLPSTIQVNYGSYPFNKGLHHQSILPGEIFQLANENDYNFYDVMHCHPTYPLQLIDSLSITSGSFQSQNLMYDHVNLFECTPANTNSKGNQIWTLIADSTIYK